MSDDRMLVLFHSGWVQVHTCNRFPDVTYLWLPSGAIFYRSQFGAVHTNRPHRMMAIHGLDDRFLIDTQVALHLG